MTRVCCGQQHGGVQCPDGKVMCCYCFSRFEVSELAIDEGGKIDVCYPCWDHEQQQIREKRGAK